ncbi:integrator complex subunit 8-like protein [Leptotrombidium deliense]|uniref:Integrator complex subunit 8-like protein n=1 Tax=Leptotrombidium deliense TaxID=299467 RepID=A0A443SU46_9ACAR|nr:integrator complex subunit 8-like protein [Leptotrombidium deliense]
MSQEIVGTVKTIWFEFLLSPDLLRKHLNDENADPTASELIIYFLTNANSASPPLLNAVDEQLNGQSLVPSVPKMDEPVSKKCMALKLLALKVAAHLKWDLDLFETTLPLTIQYLLFNELIKICDKSESNDCSLYAYILYYRWILRSLIKVTYPVRGQKGFPMPIPLLQHIDPTFVPHETMENLVKKLHELANSAVIGLEKVVQETEHKVVSKVINMPLFECFSTLNENSDDISCKWSEIESLDVVYVVDILRYELGKWFFFNENYQKSKAYLENVSPIHRKQYQNFAEYLQASTEMLREASDYDCDMQESRTLFQECLENILQGNSCEIEIIERKVELLIISDELTKFYRKCTDRAQQETIRKFALYLSTRINGLYELLKGITDTEKMDTSEVQDSGTSFVAVEEGEIDIEEEEKGAELQLLEATDPEIIQNLATRVSNSNPLVINKKWDIPRTHSLCLHNLPAPQYRKCHIVLAKAAELRRAKLYIESRTLYLSLLEDIQASLPALANVITYELLQTDLEYHFDTNDIDERRNSDLLAKCERALRNETTIAQISQISPEIIDLCCIFLLECGTPMLRDFLQYTNVILKLSACLWIICKDVSVVNTSRMKDVWDFVLSSVSKRQQNFANALSFTALYNFVRRMKNNMYITTMIQCLVKIYNLVVDNQSIEISGSCIPNLQWPQTLGVNSSNIILTNVSILTETLLDKGLNQRPSEIYLIRCKADLKLSEGLYTEALKHYITIILLVTDYFTSFGNPCEEEIIQRMIKCSTNLNCFTQAAVLHQMTRDPNYSYIFMALSEKNCYDSCDDLYCCFWDITIIEYLVNLHTRRGEIDRKHKAIQMIGQLELNANNGEDISKEAANVRRGKFFRIMAKKYL